jgi:SagB-type dehydrogenase family enzyme
MTATADTSAPDTSAPDTSAPGNAAPDTTKAGAVAGSDGVMPELVRLLRGADPETQAVVYRALSRALVRSPWQTDGPTFRDESALFHSAMKFEGLAIDHQELGNTQAPPVTRRAERARRFPLPAEPLPIDVPFDRALRARASRRDFGPEPVGFAQLGTLLHYAYGVRKRIVAYNRRGFPVRFTPSSGGLQSTELYLVVNSVEDLPQGLYHYAPDDHAVELLSQGNMRRTMVQLCLQQEWVHYAGAVLALTCVPGRVVWKYGARAYRCMQLDAGFLGQSLYLVSNALGLRGTAVAGFIEDAVDQVLGLDGHDEFTTLLYVLGTKPPEVPRQDSR